jgi:predicted Zn finger-like uncharacterized protein
MIIACPRCEATYAVDVAVFGTHGRIVQCSACHNRWPQPAKVDSEPDAPGLAVSYSPRSGGEDSPELVDSLPDESAQTAAIVAPSLPSSANGDSVATGALGCEPGEEKPANAVHPAALSPDQAESDPPPADAPTSEPARPQLHRGGHALVAATAAAATALSLTALLILLRGPVLSTMPEAAKLYGLLGLAPDTLGQGLQIREIASARERVGGQDVLKVTGMVVNVVQSRESLPTLRITLFDTADQELQWIILPPALDSLDPGQTLPFEAEIPTPSHDARLLRVGFVAAPD